MDFQAVKVMPYSILDGYSFTASMSDIQSSYKELPEDTVPDINRQVTFTSNNIVC